MHGCVERCAILTCVFVATKTMLKHVLCLTIVSIVPIHNCIQFIMRFFHCLSQYCWNLIICYWWSTDFIGANVCFVLFRFLLCANNPIDWLILTKAIFLNISRVFSTWQCMSTSWCCNVSMELDCFLSLRFCVCASIFGMKIYFIRVTNKLAYIRICFNTSTMATGAI